MRLNYTNRKITGSKLGAAVKRDILKHVQPQSKSPRAPKDPHLELNLQGKSLCDEGLELICEGLSRAIESGYVKLDELNLSENNLTLAGLKHLTVVVQLASRDLKDLDLRCNGIRVVSEADAEIWETFLDTGFRDACSLRRLDLSENPIEDRGTEIFTKVYSRELPIVLPRLAGSPLMESSDEDWNMDSEGDSDEAESTLQSRIHSMSISKTPTLSESPPSLQSTSKSTGPQSILPLNRRSSGLSLASGGVELHGLRSIPFLVFSQTSMTDRSALFLSYILPIHPTPERLLRHLPPARPGIQVEILQNYEAASGCHGLIYQPNEHFTTMGLRALELAEALRDGILSSGPRDSKSRRVSDASITPQTPIRIRKESFGISHPPHTSPTSGTFSTELERARSKIQGNLLKDLGVGATELWRTALKMLSISRTIFFKEEVVVQESFPFFPHPSQHSSPIRSGYSSLGSMPFSLHPLPPVKLSADGSNVGLPAPTLPTGWTSAPSSGNHGGTPHPTDAPSSPGSLRDNSNSSPATSSHESLRKRPLAGNLDTETWVRIIALAADPKGILTTKQRWNIVEWAKRGDTLDRERDLAGKPRSVQIWRLLEAIECLGFEL